MMLLYVRHYLRTYVYFSILQAGRSCRYVRSSSRSSRTFRWKYLLIQYDTLQWYFRLLQILIRYPKKVIIIATKECACQQVHVRMWIPFWSNVTLLKKNSFATCFLLRIDNKNIKINSKILQSEISHFQYVLVLILCLNRRFLF